MASWDFSTLSYDSIYLATGVGKPNSIRFNPAGTILYIIDYDTDTVRQHVLSSPWELDTAGSVDAYVSINAQDGLGTGVEFNLTGTKMYICGRVSQKVHQYSMNTAWDLTDGVTYDGYFDISLTMATPYGIMFDPTGIKMYIGGLYNGGVATIAQFTLTTAWDITDGADEDTHISVNAQASSLSAISFKSDGTKFYFSSDGNDRVYQYSVTTPWDLTGGISYDNVSFYVYPQDSDVKGLFFGDNGAKMYIAGDSSNNIYQYSFAQPAYRQIGIDFQRNYSADYRQAGIDLQRDARRNLVAGVDFQRDIGQNFVYSGVDLQRTIRRNALAGVDLSHDARTLAISGIDLSRKQRAICTAGMDLQRSVRKSATAGIDISRETYTRAGFEVWIDGAIKGFIDRNASPLALTGIPEATFAEGEHTIEIRPAGWLWKAGDPGCRFARTLSVTITGGGEVGDPVVPGMQNLSSTQESGYTVITWTLPSVIGAEDVTTFGLWFSPTSPVDVSGTPDIVLSCYGGAGQYCYYRSQTASEYVAVAAFIDDTQGDESELYLELATTAPASPVGQWAEEN